MQPIEPSLQLPAQQPIVYAIPQTIPKVDSFQSRRSVVNGILQIIVGAFCIIVSSIALGLGTGMEWIARGYWVAAFYIVTGSLGIAAGKKTSKCLKIAFMVLCIIAASLFAPGNLGAALIRSAETGVEHNSRVFGTQKQNFNGEFGAQVTLSILSVIEFAFAVWGSTIWCKAVGCCSDNQTATPVQLVQISNGQPIVLVQASGGQYVPQYSDYPAPADQGYHLPEKVQPNNHHDDTNPSPVGAYQRFA